MASPVLLPLLMSALSQHNGLQGLHGLQGLQGLSSLSGLPLTKDSVAPGDRWRALVQRWRAQHQHQMVKWAEDGPFAGDKDHSEEEAQWKTVVEKEGAKDHEEWQREAWGLLGNWLKDDSMESINMEGLPGMIHLTTRLTTNNNTEERVAVVPTSSLLPLLSHMATSPMFMHYAPMVLPFLIPAFLLFFLGPFLLVPLLVVVVGVPLLVMTVTALSTAASALLPLGLGALGHSGLPEMALRHLVTWASNQDVGALLERVSESEGAVSTLSTLSTLSTTAATSTLAPPLASTLDTLVSEVPRMMGW